MLKILLNPQYIHGDFFSVKGDAVKLLKHHLEILLQFVPGSAIFLIDWLDYSVIRLSSGNKVIVMGWGVHSCGNVALTVLGQFSNIYGPQISENWPRTIRATVTSVTCPVWKYALRMRNRKLRNSRHSEAFWPRWSWPEVCFAHGRFFSRFFLCSSTVVTWLPDVTEVHLIPSGFPWGILYDVRVL